MYKVIQNQLMSVSVVVQIVSCENAGVQRAEAGEELRKERENGAACRFGHVVQGFACEIAYLAQII